MSQGTSYRQLSLFSDSQTSEANDDRSGGDSGVSGVTLLLGPARCGKTTQLLHQYRQILHSGPPGSALWLAPTRRVVAQIQQRLFEGDLHAVFSPGVMTFDQFASGLLLAGDEVVDPLSPTKQRQLITRLIRDANRQELLEHFAPLAESPGLVDLVQEFITELKQQNISPDDLAEVLSKRDHQTAKDRELHLLYARYQEFLLGHDFFDAEGCYWAAQERLQNNQWEPFQDLAFVVADGFTAFSHSQLQMLGLLAAKAMSLTVSLPLDLNDDRGDLFARQRETLTALRAYLPKAVLQTLPRPNSPDPTTRQQQTTATEQPRTSQRSGPLEPTGNQAGIAGPYDSSWPMMQHLERELFRSPREQQPCRQTAGIELLAAAGELAELELIGRRIKQLLIDGDPETGAVVVPSDVLVIFRQVSPVLELVEEVFGELGIPYTLEVGPPLARAAGLSRLVSLLELKAEDWPFRRLLSLLGNNYFQPDWPQWQDGAAVVAAQRMIHCFRVPRGSRRLLKLVEQVTDPANSRLRSSTERKAEAHAAQLALPLLSRLHQTLDQVPKSATCLEWVDVLTELAQQTGWFSVVLQGEEPAHRLDQAAWTHLKLSLESLAELDQRTGGEDAVISLAELLTRIGELLRCESLPPVNPDVGRVRVLSAHRVGGLRVGYVLICGLAEGQFPRPERQDRLYSEAETKELNAVGLGMLDRDQQAQQEMLLFYQAITRADRRLYLSYPALDDKAQPVLPSPFFQEVEGAFGYQDAKRKKPHLATEGVLDLTPVPPEVDTWHHQPACLRHWRVAALAEALGPAAIGLPAPQKTPRGPPPVRLLAALARSDHHRALCDNLTAALRMIHDRSRRETFGLYEGLMSSQAARGWLAEKFGQKPWSPSHLEHYLLCPFRFFLGSLLGIEPLPELELASDYFRRGHIFHDTLDDLHRQLNDHHKRPVSPQEVAPEVLAQTRQQTFDFVVGRWRDGDPVSEALLEIERREVEEMLDRYFRQHEQYDKRWTEFQQPLRPTGLEVSFGIPPRSPEEADQWMVEEPLTLSDGEVEVRISGRIDRLDVGRIGGRTVFNILDYKTGSDRHYKIDKVRRGEVVQLPLYALATQQLLLAEQDAVPWLVGYWIVKTNKGIKEQMELHRITGEKVEPTEEWERLQQTVRQQVFRVVRGVQDGIFPVFSTDDDCTSSCAFRTVCRINHVRALQKSWPPTVEDTAGAVPVQRKDNQ